MTLALLGSCSRNVDDRGLPGPIAVEGNGGLSFGPVAVGNPTPRTVTLTSHAQSDFELVAEVRGTGFSLASTTFSLPRDGTVAIEVLFAPPVEGRHEGTLSIRVTNSAGVEPLSLSLVGEGIGICADCALAPATTCGGAVLDSFERFGTCDDGRCAYRRRFLACAAGCANDRCADVACGQGAPRHVWEGPGSFEGPSVAWTGEFFGLGYTSSMEGAPMALYSRAPEPAGGEALNVSRAEVVPGSSELVWAGDSFANVFLERVGGQNRLAFARVDAVDKSVPVHVGVGAAAVRPSRPRLAWNSWRNEFGIVWTDERAGAPAVYFALVRPDGAGIGADVRISANPEGSRADAPRVVWAEGAFALAWSDDRSGKREIYFARVSPNGTRLGDEVQVTNAGGSSTAPSLAAGDGRLGLAWVDDRAGKPEIFATSLTLAGEKAHDEVQMSTSTDRASQPAIAWARSGFGLAWTDKGHGIRFAQLGDDGLARGSRLVTASATGAASSLSWGAGQFGVAWEEQMAGKTEALFSPVCP